MKKLLLIPLLLVLTACPKFEQNARDTAAALGGAITAAQVQHQAECVATPSASTCTLINRAAATQNTLITSIEAYCGWSSMTLPTDNTACVPVSNAKAGLQTAINNANAFIGQLKGVIQ